MLFVLEHFDLPSYNATESLKLIHRNKFCLAYYVISLKLPFCKICFPWSSLFYWRCSDSFCKGNILCFLLTKGIKIFQYNFLSFIREMQQALSTATIITSRSLLLFVLLVSCLSHFSLKQ